jgi:hypothetical protein
MTPKAQATKATIDILDYKPQGFCTHRNDGQSEKNSLWNE